MTKHNTARPFNTATAVIVRRRNGRARFQDPVTARMSGWMPDPNRKRTFTTTITPEAVQAMHADALRRMRKPELQALANSRGIPFNSKTTNDALRAALSA